MSKWTAAQFAAAQQRTAKPSQKPVDSPKRTRATTTAPTQSKPANGKRKGVDTGTVSRGELNYFHLHTMVRTKHGIDWKAPVFRRVERKHLLLK